MDLIAVISIIVTVLGAAIGLYSIFQDKFKLKKEKQQIIETIESLESNSMVNWAKQKDIEKDFFSLIERLVSSQEVNFIKENSAADFVVKYEANDNSYIPFGTSYWIIKNVKQLSKEQIEKEINFLADKDTCVFVTPHLINNKEELLKKFQNKNLKIFDALSLSKWLDEEPSISIWFDIKTLYENSSEGVILPDEFWEEWSTGPNIKLQPNILIGGRDEEKEKILNLEEPSIKVVKGVSREEAVAFIVTCFITSETHIKSLLNKCFIVDNPNTLRQLIKKNDSLLFIPRFEDSNVFNLAIKNGHTIILPVGNEYSNSWTDIIELPPIDRKLFVNSLVESNIEEERAEKLSKESARNMTVFRRQLEFNRTLPKWSNIDKVNNIIPALLVGRWDENSEKDRQLIERIAKKNYEDFISNLNKWSLSSDSPIVKIGSMWRLTSPMDVWSIASRYISSNDFELLKNSFLEALNEVSPKRGINYDNLFNSKKESHYSKWIKEGLSHSIILVAVYGDKLKFDLQISSQLWVDGIVSSLLNSNDINRWQSFETFLPLMAEASPDSFLNAIEKNLGQDSVISKLFEEKEEGLFGPYSSHTGLLWGLENVAWLPDYLSRATLVLGKLASIDPGGNLSNRPINSLTEIYKPWHYQTLARYEERMEILELLAKQEPEIAWKILCRLLPETHGVGHPTHKMRWRLYDVSFKKSIKYQEIWDTHSKVVEILISSFIINEERFSDLIEHSSKLSEPDRNIILDYLVSVIDEFQQEDYVAWHTTRNILSRHRSHPNTKWAIPEDKLSVYQKIYDKLTPLDEVIKVKWLFDEHGPNLPEGNNFPNITLDEQDKLVREKRIEAIKNLHAKLGVDEVIGLVGKVKQQWILGEITANIIDNKKQIIKICEFLKCEKESREIYFIHAFLFKKVQTEGVDWSYDLFEDLKKLKYSNKSLANIFIPLMQNRVLWNKLESYGDEIVEHYWKNVYPRIHDVSSEDIEYGINMLMKYKRFVSAIEVCYFQHENLSTEIIVKVLENASIYPAEENTPLDGYKISNLFIVLDERDDVEKKPLIKLEWHYLPILASYGNSRSPKLLHEELASNPSFFVDVVKMLFKSDDDEINKKEKEAEDISDENRVERAKRVYELLNEWKEIPGVDKQGNIDKKVLNDWINESRRLAKECSRLTVIDMQIGKLLAQYPEKDEIWPPSEICEIIETINTDSLKSNFSSAVFNKRSFSSRGAFEGGGIERGHAEYFEKLAKANRNKFPIVSTILNSLSKGYLQDAKRMDEEARRKELDV